MNIFLVSLLMDKRISDQLKDLVRYHAAGRSFSAICQKLYGDRDHLSDDYEIKKVIPYVDKKKLDHLFFDTLDSIFKKYYWLIRDLTDAELNDLRTIIDRMKPTYITFSLRCPPGMCIIGRYSEDEDATQIKCAFVETKLKRFEKALEVTRPFGQNYSTDEVEEYLDNKYITMTGLKFLSDENLKGALTRIKAELDGLETYELSARKAEVLIKLRLFGLLNNAKLSPLIREIEEIVWREAKSELLEE
jgi:hypothetical protein